MQPGTVVDGKYVIEREIGAGGMGTVFFARRRSDQRPVALKLLLEQEPPSGGRFEREVAALQTLQHPAIVHYVDHGLVDDHNYLVMDWVEGQSLLDRLATRGVTNVETVALGIRLADALAHAHARGLLHRDLKPGNLIVSTTDPSHVTIIDFGIARRMRDSQKLTQTGQVVGSPGYLSPEQASGATKLDARADVFALGCLLYECLAGRQPFPGSNPVAVLAKVLMSDPQPLDELAPGTPPALVALVTAMLEKDPVDRPASAEEVARRLRALPPLSPDAPRTTTTLLDVETSALAPPAASEDEALSMTLAARPRNSAPTSFVIASRVEDGELFTEASEREVEELRVLQQLTAPFGGQVHQLTDHSYVAVVTGEELRTVAQKAAECALAMRSVLGDTPMITASAPNRSALQRAIETSAQALQHDALAAMFGDSDGAIRIDTVSAAQLGPRFTVRRDERGTFLIARA